MNKKLINFIKTEENLTLETKITLFNPHVVQTDLIERNASRESIQIIRTENYTITRCIIKTRPRNIFLQQSGTTSRPQIFGRIGLCKDGPSISVRYTGRPKIRTPS